MAQELVDHAAALQQHQPGIGAHQHAGPERQHDQRQDEDAPAFRQGVGEIGDGIAEQQRNQRDREADLEGQRKAAPIDVLGEDAPIILQREAVMVDRLPGEPADRQHDQSQDHEQRRRHQRQHQPVLTALMLLRWIWHGRHQRWHRWSRLLHLSRLRERSDREGDPGEGILPLGESLLSRHPLPNPPPRAGEGVQRPCRCTHGSSPLSPHFCMNDAQRFSAASPADEDHQA